MKVYQKLAGKFNAYLNCIKNKNEQWEEKHYNSIISIINSLPHGSGIDGKTVFNFDESNLNKLVIDSSYHLMDDVGMYDGWIDFQVIIKPNWLGIDLKIKGKFGERQDLKSIIGDIFYNALIEEI